MNIIGITGGIGMGKSACAEWLRGIGHPVVDTDDISRELTRDDAGVLAEIRSVFGDGVFNHDGELDRGALARSIFADEIRRQVLEGILHPRIREGWRSEVLRWKQAGSPLGFVVIPLLFETNAEELFDSIICVACSKQTQLERLNPRGWEDGQIALRVGAQMPVKDKMLRANYVIWTEGTMDTTAEQLKMVLRRLG